MNFNKKVISRVTRKQCTVKEKEISVMGTFSSLCTDILDFGTNKSNPRYCNVVKITPHHMAGVIQKGKDCASQHLNGGREASANYYIGNSGDLCGGVSEDRRAWTSSSPDNDQRAITIEVSNCSGDPDWNIGDAAYNTLVKLCADVCNRYGINPHYDGTKGGTITMHKQFAATACPGPTLEGYIVSGKFERDVKAAMGQPEPAPQPTPTPTPQPTPSGYPTCPFLVKVIIPDLNYRETPNGTVKGQTGIGTFTIVAVDGDWGKLKSGAGWIYLANPSYCTIEGTVSDKEYYTVKAGDTLSRIAAKYNTTVSSLINLNPQIDDPDLIYVGDQIRVK